MMVNKPQEERGVADSLSTSVLAPIPYSTLKQKRQGLIKYFQSQCADPWFLDEFHDFRRRYSEPTFQSNPHLSSQDRDSKCMQLRFASSRLLLTDDDFLQVAFHGTPARNVSDILQNGLDPKLRCNQRFGPGEYFTADPSVAATHCGCNGGEVLRIVVCVVILPKNPSIEHIVIENPNHHIPIGIVIGNRTRGCLLKVLSENQKQMMALRSINFQKRLQHCELPEQLDRIKRQIVLDLQKKEPAMASDLYQQFSALLKGTPESQELLQAVLAQHFGDAVIGIQFPGLLESCMIVKDCTCEPKGDEEEVDTCEPKGDEEEVDV